MSFPKNCENYCIFRLEKGTQTMAIQIQIGNKSNQNLTITGIGNFIQMKIFELQIQNIKIKGVVTT